MPARVQVIVETKSIGGGVLRAITSEFGQLGNVVQELTAKNINWGNVAEQATRMVIDAARDAVKVTQEYAGQVRDLAQVSGTSAEEASRMIQVLDDWQVSTEDVMTATRKLTQNGLTPNLETLAQLSDKYLTINNEQERNKFIIDNLGRSGLQWVNVLKQGGAALREQGEAVNGNLILTDNAIRQSEEYRLALDSWNDAVMGVKIAVGTHLIPALTELIDKETFLSNSEQRWNQARITGANMGRESAMIEANHNKIVEAASAAADSATRNYIAMGKAIQTGGTAALAAVPDYQKQLDTIQKLNGATLEQIKNTAYMDLRQRLQESGNQLTDQEAQLLEQAGLQMGIFDQKTINTANAIDRLNTELEQGVITIAQYTSALNNIPTTISTSINMSGGITGTTCFLAGTRILMADNSLKPIERIAVGEWIQSYDFYQGKLVKAQVALTLHHEPHEMGAYYIVINDRLRVTPNHLLFVNRQWQAAETVQVGDVLQGFDFLPVPVLSVSCVGERVPTYNLHIDNEHHNYFAEGILVHNAKANQQGGEVFAGSPTLVGERGAEPFVPSVNGRILGHAESLRALALGSGMGGGGAYNFYGNVTLTIGGDDASGLLSVR